VKRNSIVDRLAEADEGLERIKHLEQQLTPVPLNSDERRRLRAAIRIEAEVYRRSLDTEQAAATHDPRPLSAVEPGSLNRTSRTREVES
jgi:hypothetical protein